MYQNKTNNQVKQDMNLKYLRDKVPTKKLVEKELQLLKVDVANLNQDILSSVYDKVFEWLNCNCVSLLNGLLSCS